MNLLLVGQPNVGKSSIFNILVKKNKNIIHSSEGTTRDWHSSSLKNFPNINIFDSPGLKSEKNRIYFKDFEILFKKIDIFMYVVDYTNTSDIHDNQLISKIRKFNKKIILIVNKDDNLKKLNNFDYLGILNIFHISCSHRLGIDELIKFISKYNKNTINDLKTDFSVSIYGKPNAGKSTILNNILGYKRSAISEVAGTTSDIVEECFSYKKNIYKILDTAGIYKKSKTQKKSLNYISTKKSIDSFKHSDLNLLIINSSEGFDRQTKRIYNMLIKKSNSLVLIFNKIDLLEEKKIFISNIQFQIKNNISLAKNVSLIFISALKSNDIKKIKDIIHLKAKELTLNVNTNKINLWLKKAVSLYPHPLIRNKKINFKYATQIKSKPIILKIFCNHNIYVKENYKTYLLNDFIKNFKIKDKKIKLIFSSSANPYK